MTLRLEISDLKSKLKHINLKQKLAKPVKTNGTKYNMPMLIQTGAKAVQYIFIYTQKHTYIHVNTNPYFLHSKSQ